MNPASLKKLALIFSVVTIVGYSIAIACADGWFYYDYDSDFTPEVFVDESYSPLLFAPNETFYGNGFDTNYNGRFNDEIVQEWSGYLGETISQQQLSFLLLNDSALNDIRTLFYASQKKAKVPAAYSGLSLTDAKTKGFLEFLHYAKEIEKSCINRANPWDYAEVTTRNNVPALTIAAVEKLYHDTRDPFLKNRLWFQSMKAYFYGAKQNDAVTFFEKTKSSQPKNTLYYRAISYVAGVHYRAKNFATANYLYSTVFDHSPALRQVAAYNFHPQENADFHAALALTTDKKEKAALWSLLGYYGDELTAIREIYALDPASPHLSYLLTRAINKMEVSLNGYSFKTSAEYKKNMREVVSDQTLQLVEKIANEGNTSQPHLWNVSAGYLNTFAGKYTQSAKYFDKAEAVKEAALARQIRVLRIINTLCNLTKMDPTAEQKLLQELQWIQAECQSAGEHFRCSHAINWSKRYISTLYQESNNHVMAELFHHDNEYYRDPKDLEAMKMFMQSTTLNAWQKFALKNYPFSLSDIYEYQGVMSAFKGDLEAAIGYMEKSTRQHVELLGNPFNGKIKDCHDCDHAAPQKVKYTKLSLLQKMKEMQANIDSKNDIYNNSLLLANAYYNMTYHGNARVFYQGDVMNQNGNDIDPFYHPQLLNCDRARKYYQQAFEAAVTDEQKAKCVYMLAKCERNEYYNSTVYSGNGEFDEYFVSWESFKKLKEEYSATKYYQDVIKECGYFKTYVENN